MPSDAIESIKEDIDFFQNMVNESLEGGLSPDPLAEQILKNIDNVFDILENRPKIDSKDLKYFLNDPLYNSLENDSNKIPVTYVKPCLKSLIDITNYLRSGILDNFLKDRGGLNENDFYYYTYLSEKTLRIDIREDNYELIYSYIQLINHKLSLLIHLSKNYYVTTKRLYNFSKPKVLEIAYKLLKDHSLIYKFNLDDLKRVPSVDIIELMNKTWKLRDHPVIKASIKTMKNKKMAILSKVKREFNGSGSIWKFICSSDVLYLEELRFIADINGVQNTGILTKQDICSELEKISLGNKSSVIDSCQNETDISGDDIRDIKPEYFFLYKENGKNYCTDIRSAYTNIKAGNNKNPYTNVELQQETIDRIVYLYETNIKPEEEEKATLTQLLANFSSKIPYLNSVELYIKGTREQLDDFYSVLEDLDLVLIDSWGGSSLEEEKYKLIETLLLDRNFENFKYQVRQEYNNVFNTDEEDS